MCPSEAYLPPTVWKLHHRLFVEDVRPTVNENDRGKFEKQRKRCKTVKSERVCKEHGAICCKGFDLKICRTCHFICLTLINFVLIYISACTLREVSYFILCENDQQTSFPYPSPPTIPIPIAWNLKWLCHNEATIEKNTSLLKISSRQFFPEENRVILIYQNVWLHLNCIHSDLNVYDVLPLLRSA